MSYIEDRASWFAGQGLWQHLPESDWRDWNWQLKNRMTSAAQLEQYMTLTPEEKAGCMFASHRLALAITPYFFNLVDRTDPDCPIRRQVIPRSEKWLYRRRRCSTRSARTHIHPCRGWSTDIPTACCFLVTDRCAAYCRYCTRSRLVSNAQTTTSIPSRAGAPLH